MTLDAGWKCWNLFCIAGDCDGVSHVDVTGHSWRQERGTEYCLVHDRYDACDVTIPFDEQT